MRRLLAPRSTRPKADTGALPKALPRDALPAPQPTHGSHRPAAIAGAPEPARTCWRAQAERRWNNLDWQMAERPQGTALAWAATAAPALWVARQCSACAVGPDEATTGVSRKALEVSRPSDPHEIEADRQADAFVAQASDAHARQSARPTHAREGGSGPTRPGRVERDRGARAAGRLSRKAPAAAAPTAAVAGHPALAPLSQARGRALPGPVRRPLERHFGAELSAVRVHDDDAADLAASRLQARAFALGPNLYFARGQFAPGTTAGRHLLAHEVTHTLQAAPPGRVQRELTPGGDGTVALPKGPPRLNAAARRWMFLNVPLADEPEFVDFQLRALLAREGLAGADRWFTELVAWRPPQRSSFMPPAHGRASGGWTPRTGYDAAQETQSDAMRVRAVVMGVYPAVRKEAVTFLTQFYDQAKTHARTVLKANEDQTRAEIARYKLTRTTTTRPLDGDPADGGKRRSITETHYGMDADPTSVTSLQTAAKILLPKKQAIDRLQRERRVIEMAGDPKDPAQVKASRRKTLADNQAQIDSARQAYLRARGGLIQRFPILGAASDLEASTGDLQTLATAKSGAADFTRLLAERAYDQLDKIARVRDHLDQPSDINLWRQDKIVGLTRAALGADQVPWQTRLVADKVKDEAPGVLWDVALAVLNIAALLLAGPTGGLSLVVAFAANSVAAAEHVKEYIMDSALSGTAFDRAQAISAEEPSLLWLALDIVGVIADFGPMAKAVGKSSAAVFKALRGPVRALQAAKGEKAVLEATEALRKLAAAELGEARAAERIVQQALHGPRGETAVLEATLSKGELKSLLDAGKLADGEMIGAKVLSAGGEVNLSKAGHLYSCHSPCRVLRDKYAAVIAQDAHQGLRSELHTLEAEGLAIAGERRAAQKAGDAKALAAADARAADLKKKVAGLEPRLRAQMPERLARVEALKALKGRHPVFDKVGLDGLERALAKAPDVQQIKGQLLEELLGARMAGKAEREAMAGAKAVEAAKAAGGEIQFIPGHLIQDESGKLFTDGVLAYKKGDTWHVVTVFESKAGRPSAQGLKRKWKDLPWPASETEKLRWRDISESELKAMHQSTDRAARGQAQRIETWREARAAVIDDLRETDDALAKLSSTQIEAMRGPEIEAGMRGLPKSESGQARKTVERLVPNAGAPHTRIRIGTPLPDGSVRFDAASATQATADLKNTKIVGLVPDNVKGNSLMKMADPVAKGGEGLPFELKNDLGFKESELRAAAEALAEAATKAPE